MAAHASTMVTTQELPCLLQGNMGCFLLGKHLKLTVARLTVVSPH